MTEIDFHLDRGVGVDTGYFRAFESIAQEFNVGRIDQLAFKRVAYALFLHDVDIEGLHQKADFPSCIKAVVILYHELIAFGGLHHHFVVHAFEDRRSNRTGQHGCFRWFEYVYVFGADHHIHRSLLAEAFVHALEVMSGKGDLFIFNHQSVQYIALTDKVGDERIDGFIIYIDGGSDLLDAAFAHHNDGIAQGQCFFLVVGHVDEGDTKGFVHFLQFHLHVLTHLQVEGCQGFVEQQHFGLVDDGAGDGNALLLAAGEGVYIAVFVIGHTYHLQGLFHLLLDNCGRQLFKLQAESDIVEYIQVREQRIFLKHGIDRAFMRRRLCDLFSCYRNRPF